MWGLKLSIKYDISIGYTVEFLSFIEDEMMNLAFNPLAFVNVFAGFDFKITTPVIKTNLNFEFSPIQYIPADFQLTWNLDKIDQVCYSLSNARKVTAIEGYLHTEVYECQGGLFSYYTGGEGSVCEWEDYQPLLPIYSSSVNDKYDMTADYIQWRCTDESQDYYAAYEGVEFEEEDDLIEVEDDEDYYDEEERWVGKLFL